MEEKKENGQYKILVVEDDIQLVDMYRRKFELEGFTIETAEDGEVALTKIKSFKPDLVLLDIMMPKKSGLEVLQDLRKDPNTKDQIVVMLTNLGSEGTAEKIFMLGATDYIVKADYTPLEVCNRVKEILKEYAPK